jgi:hypothetical protein
MTGRLNDNEPLRRCGWGYTYRRQCLGLRPRSGAYHPKIRPSFFEVRTRTLRSRDERVFEVGGGGGNAIARGYDEVILVCLILDVGGIYLDG